VRLLSMHATSCASERNWSLWGSLYTQARNRQAITYANTTPGNSSALHQAVLSVYDIKLFEEEVA
jgi:hypothetical protein